MAGRSAAARRVFGERPTLPVALAGGVLTGEAAFRERFLQALESCGVIANPVSLVREPAQGALRLALKS